MRNLDSNPPNYELVSYGERHKWFWIGVFVGVASSAALRMAAPDALAGALARITDRLDETQRIVRDIRRDSGWLRTRFTALCTGFARWFQPRPRAFREDVQEAFRKAHRYDCLARVSEPHRTQIMAVVDYTYDHPIVREKDRKFGKDQISLSEAVREVLNANLVKWRRVQGAWTDFESLKAACYAYRGREDDPYKYAP